MKVFIVHAHAEKKSFNGALTRTAVETLEGAGHQVRVSDLYEMQFNPVSDRRNFVTVADPNFFKQQAEEGYATQHNGFAPDIQAELEKLDWCDMLIFQFPLWWFGLPAILKGWVDKVFAQSRIYGNGLWYDNGYFKGKRAVCSLTTGGPESMYMPDGLSGDIHQILYPINHGILYFVGFTALPPFLVHAATRATDEQRKEHLKRYSEFLLTLENCTPISYPLLKDYDDSFRLIKAKAEAHQL